MPDCPRCHQPVEAQAIACPYCRAFLKAHGHPGIPLYRSDGKEFLCQTCLYDADDSCTFPQRPYAQECTLYTNQQAQSKNSPVYRPAMSLSYWVRKNLAWVIVGGIAIASIAIALSRQ